MNDWTPEGWHKINQIIKTSEYDYTDDFIQWLSKNAIIWRGFASKALQAKQGSHRGRFSAMAIIQILRWETFISDADKTFKINNNRAPDLARLLMDCVPDMRGYFQIRGSEHRKDAN